MANTLDAKLGELIRAGFQVDKDGKLFNTDPKLNQAFKDFVAGNQKRSEAAAQVPDTSADALRNFDAQSRLQSAARERDNQVTLNYGLNSLPIVRDKESIKTKAYGDRLGQRVGAFGDLLGQSQLHEKDLYGAESVRLDKVLANDKYYTDVIAGLADKQIAQQGTANILNLITNLALGGAALFA